MRALTHQCPTRHRTYRTTAGCEWPQAVWVTGEGPYAVLAWCRALTVTLHASVEQASSAKQMIDDTACGGQCSRDHEIVRLG